MAKDVELDFDDNWDSDFDLGFDFDSDFSGSPKKKGSVVKRFLSGAATGAGMSIRDSQKIRQLSSALLPRSYTPAFDLYDRVDRETRQLYDRFRRGTYDGVRALQDAAHAVNTDGGKYIPKSVLKQIERFAESDQSMYAPGDASQKGIGTLEQAGDNEVASYLKESLLQQANLSEGQHRETLGAMNAGNAQTGMLLGIGNRDLRNISQGISRLVGFNEDFIGKAQRRSLDLQFRHFNLMQGYAKLSERYMHASMDQFREIAKQTAMADFEKMSSSATAKKMLRERTFTTVGRAVGGVGGVLQRLVDPNWQDAKIAGVDSHMQNAGAAISLASLAGSMGGGSDMVSMLGQMAGGKAVDMLPILLQMGMNSSQAQQYLRQNRNVGRRVQQANRRVNQVGNAVNYLVNNGAGIANRYLRNRTDLEEGTMSWEEYQMVFEADPRNAGQQPTKRGWMAMNAKRGFLNPLINNRLRDIPIDNGHRIDIQTRKLSDLTQPAQWDNLAHRTLTEVIPGWFSRIHLSLEQMRTGRDDVQATTYNYQRGQFVSQRNNTNLLRGQLFNRREYSGLATMSNNIVDELDPEKKLSASARKALSMRFLRDQDRGESFDPIHYAREEGWGDTDKADSAELARFIQQRFRITPELMAKANSTTLKGIRNSLVLPSQRANQLRNQISERVSSLRGYIPDVAEQLDILRATGNEDALRQLGVIQNTNGVDTFNNDMRWEIMRKFIENPDNKELSGGITPETLLPTRGANKGRMGRGRPAPGFTGDVSGLADAIGKLTDRLDNRSTAGMDLDPLVVQATQANTYLGELVSKTDQLLLANHEFAKMQLSLLHDRQPPTVTPEEGAAGNTSGGRMRSWLERMRSSNLSGRARDMLKGLASNPAVLYGAGAAGLAGLTAMAPRLGGVAAAGVIGYQAYKFLQGRAQGAEGDSASDNDDIYQEGNSEPLLQSVKLKAGQYYDQVSGRVITSYKYIKGAVVDAAGVVIARASDLKGKLFNQRNKRIVLINIERLKRGAIGLFNKLDPVSRLRALKDTVVGRIQTMDVYVKGEREPRLTGTGLRSGAYLDEEGHPVTKWSEIKGTVYDADGEVVLSEADIEKGLTNRFGVQINTLTRYARVYTRRLRRTAANLFAGVPGLAERIRGGAARGAGAVRDSIGGNGGVVTAIDRVYDLLDARLPGQRRPKQDGGMGGFSTNPLDEDGDGVRDNSAQDIQNKRARKAASSKEDRLIDAIEALKGNQAKKDEEKTASIFGPIMGVIGKAATAVLAGWSAIRRLGILGSLKGFLTLKWLKPLAAIIMGKRTRDEALAHARGGPDVGGGRARGKWGRRLGKVGKWGAIAAGGTALYSMFSGSAHASEATPDIGGMDGMDPSLGDEHLDVGTDQDEGTDWGGLADDALTYGSLGAAGYGAVRRRARRRTAADAASDAASEAADLGDAGRTARQTRAGKWAGRAWKGAKAAGNLVRPRLGLAGKVVGGALKGVGKAVGVAARLGRFLPFLAGGAALLGGPITAGIITAISVGSLLWDAGSAISDWINRPSKLRQVRMTMYGVDPTGKDAERIAKVEMLLKDHVTVRGGDASFTEDTPIDQALRLLITDTNDPEQVQGWVGWFTNRFKPVFLTSVAMLNKYMGNTRFEDVDKSNDVSALYLVASNTNDMMSHIEPNPYSIAPEAIGESPMYDEGQTSSRVSAVLKAMGKEADKKPSAVPGTMINDFGGTVTGAIDPGKRQTAGGYFSTEDNGIRRRGRDSIRPERPLDLGMNLASISVDASDNDVSSMLPKPGESLDELTMVRMKAYGLKKLEYAKIATFLRMEKVVESNIARNGNALRFTGKSGDLYRLTAVQFGRKLNNQADFMEWGQWFLKRFLPTYFIYHRMVTDTVQGGLPSATYTSLNAQQRYTIGQAVVAATYKEGRAEEVSVWTVDVSPFKGEHAETDPDSVKLAMNNLQAKAKQGEVKAPTDVATTGQQGNGTSPVPDTVKQQFDDKYSFTARAPGQSKSRYQVTTANTVKDQALSGSFGSNPGTTGAGAYMGAGDSLPSVDKTGKVEPMAVGPGKQKGIDTVLKMAKKEGITDKKELAALLANLDHESGGFTRTEENLNYKPARLLQVFPKRIGSMDRAQQIASAGPAAIGNAVYGGRMGNDKPGDGYNYRGGGLIQLTGKDNYEAFSKDTGIDIVSNPDRVRKDPQTAALAALWFWKNRKGLSDAAKAGNIDKASYLINGGTNGLEDRRMKYQQYLGMFNDGVLDTNDVSTDDTKTEPTPAPGADAPSQVAANVPGGNDNSGVAGPATTASLSDPASGSPNMTTSFSEPAATPAPQQSSVSSASSAAAPSANMNTSFREPAPAPASAPSSDGSGQTNTILSSIHDVLSQMLTVLQNSSNAPSGGTGAQAKPAQKNANPANSSMNIGMDRSFS